ncbi:MAG: TIGR04348 family glycosyltransferase [Burkholderiales bacterium]|nr:TIGR04348 family glycosyltransferase [Burkholderiales bacterium]
MNNKKKKILIVTPALSDANNGNWQTAKRWAEFLSGLFDVDLQKIWNGQPCDLMIALHARRSAASITAFKANNSAPLVVALTGTDLYRDIQTDADAQRSLVLADRLIVLNELGTKSLPQALQAKTRVVLQSTPTQETLKKTDACLNAVMVGHLRQEKSPETFFQAAELLAGCPDIQLTHIGASLDESYRLQALELTQRLENYRWLGAVEHAATLQHIQQAHVLVHCSRMEGGAHVVMEAICAGTPVLASRIDGNVGLLGADYPGYFDFGDAGALADLLLQMRNSQGLAPVGSGVLEQCRLAAAALAPRFHPDRERDTLLGLVAACLIAER